MEPHIVGEEPGQRGLRSHPFCSSPSQEQEGSFSHHMFTSLARGSRPEDDSSQHMGMVQGKEGGPGPGMASLVAQQ